jgi:CO/xanthine dehydrogenase Mo-binding subunit
MDSFVTDDLVASCVHGEAVPAAFAQALNDAVATFVVDRNVDNIANALLKATKEHQSRK